jgi:hypothetical protein
MMRSMSAVLMAGAALAVAGFLACSNNDNGSTTPTTTPVITSPPVTLPDSPGTCSPTPPPLYRMLITIQSSNGHTRTLKVVPHVPNVDKYCDRVGFGSYKECPVRADSDPQKLACEGLVLGKATDTGRWGPTWSYIANTEPAHACVGGDPGCQNHPSDQYLVITNGTGQFFATASGTVPLSTVPGYEGSRNVRCWISSESDSSCN